MVVHLVLAFVLATGLWSPDKALAKKVDCGVLLERMQKTGESPGIELNPADGIITVRLSRDHCQEPIKTWIGRPSPREQKRKQPSQSAPKSAPQLAPQTAPANAPPPPAQTPALPKTRAACDQRLDMLWPESQVIKITGVSYWMSRAFTMEFGSEPGVDDVSFVLKALDDSEQIIRYFGVPGEVHGRSLEGLSLADHGLVKRLCFGNMSYKKPPSFGLEPASNLIDIPIPDLAAEYKASLEGKGKTAKSKSKLEESSWLLWAIFSGGAVLGIGVGALFFIHRRKTDDGDDGDADAEED